MSYEVVIFGIHLKLAPVAFSIPIGSQHWDVYWYGIIIAIGFLLALIFGMRNAARFEIQTDRMLDVVLVATPVAILCARAYYLIFDGEPLTGIGDFFGFGNSSGFAGLAIYGGVIGAFLSGALMCKIRKVNMLDMFDIASLGFLIGQGVGRWGNFINQEAYGAFTGSSWWGMESDITVAEMGKGMVHPCFLYESIWCVAGFFLINHLSKKRRFKGETVLMYCVWYGFGRGFIELLRTDSLMLGPIKVSCLLSFLLVVVAASLLVYMRVKSAQAIAQGEYQEVFTEEINESPESEEELPGEAESDSDEQVQTEEISDEQDN